MANQQITISCIVQPMMQQPRITTPSTLQAVDSKHTAIYKPTFASSSSRHFTCTQRTNQVSLGGINKRDSCLHPRSSVSQPGLPASTVALTQYAEQSGEHAGQLMNMLMAIDVIWGMAQDLLKSIKLAKQLIVDPGFVKQASIGTGYKHAQWQYVRLARRPECYGEI